MIESKEFQAPKSTNASGMRDINNVIVDSGYRFGQQVYRLILTQLDSITPREIDLETNSNGLTVDVGGSVINTAFNTDTATTISDFATAIQALGTIESATVVDGYIVEVKVVENSEVLISSPGVTGGTVRVTLTVELENDLRIVPAIVTIDNEPEALRIDEGNPAGTDYIGYAVLGTGDSDPLWRIKKLVTSGTVTTITYADGNKLMDNIWDDRTTLTYS